MNVLRRLPSYALNGITVALGIGCIQLAIGALAGSHAAQLALSGAVCASLADVPNTVSRTHYRVSAAALLSLIAAMVAAALKPHPVALGFAVAAVAFVAMMTMAWGARAGPVSFAPILSMVFAIAIPSSAEPPWPVLALWNATGGLAYLAWSHVAGRLLQRRYRRLALCDTLGAAATLLRARAELLVAKQSEADAAPAMQTWIKGETAMAERLQTARDFVFVARNTRSARRDIAILLHAIDLRDILLASRLDLDRLGSDAGGRWILQQVADALRDIGAGLEAAALALRDGVEPSPLAPPPLDDRALLAQAPIAIGDARARLLPAVADRLGKLRHEVTHIHALLHGEQEQSPLTRAELRRFVAPEGWPLKTLKSQLAWQSPVFRHAIRCALALGCAYFIALLSPWSSHPHWLVLSVAVVLRGNLEQTLARRNARVLGTLLGCAAVVLLARTQSALWLGLIFLASVGIAHAFVLQRYWLTASAATVMALLQSHMVNPAGGFAVAERVADTLLGALIAWAFSYVLPSWERRHLPQALARVLKDLGDYADHALSLSSVDELEQRLARRRAYESLSALAAALQRSAAEPKAVQVPVKQVAALVDHGQRLMAHLSLVRMTLTHRSANLDTAVATQALADAHAALAETLDLGKSVSAADTARTDPEDLSLLPKESPARDILPWLQRRLRVLVHDAQQVRAAATAATQRP